MEVDISLAHTICFFVFALKAILILNILRVSFNVKTLKMYALNAWNFSQLLFSSCCCTILLLIVLMKRWTIRFNAFSANVIFHLQRMMQNICHNAMANICKRSRKRSIRNCALLSHTREAVCCAELCSSGGGGATFYLWLEGKTKKKRAKNIFHGKYGTVCWCKR